MTALLLAEAAHQRMAAKVAELAEGIGEHLFCVRRSGTVTAFDGLLLTIEGLDCGPGVLLSVAADDGTLPAETIGFRGNALLAMALARGAIRPRARATLIGRADRVGCGAPLAGRVTDAMGRPVDGKGPLHAPFDVPLDGRPLPPLDRAEVTEAVPTGVRAIDSLLTLGRGQRIGLIAGTGVGKSSLMRDLARGAEADITIVALIGERGREISGFIADLGEEALAHTHVIAVPADEAAPLRVRGARRAMAVAEGFRAMGLHVLLLLDSLTRVAHAQREVGLAAGEPPGPRGYPASALAFIPRLVERAGCDRRSGGAITAIFTVLADGDDTIADPIVDTARGVLDGHVLLSRAIAARSRFPAIDLAHSVSRTMAACVSPSHAAAAAAFVRDAALVEANRDLVTMGAYAPGQDQDLDRALARAQAIEDFLAQPRGVAVPMAAGVERLLATWGEREAAA
ncbi:MAG: FliI/YscN family ATPase [Sphingomonadaceae bacterium]